MAAQTLGSCSGERGVGGLMETSRWDRHLARAQALARQGRLADAIDAVFRVIAVDPHYEPAWIFAATAYCRQNYAAEVPAMVDRYQAISGRGAVLIKETMNFLARDGQRGAVEALANAFPTTHAGFVLGLYYRGCVLMQAGDDSKALSLFDLFRQRVDHYTGLIPFLTSPFFNVIYRQGTLVAGASAFAPDSDPGPPAEPEEAPVWLKPPTALQGRPVLLCAANALYFAQFAEGFARSVLALRMPAVLHFHVINPDDSSRTLMASLPSLEEQSDVVFDFSTATLPIEAGATWFACSRFLVAPALLTAYQAPLWLFDIDLDLTSKLPLLIQSLSEVEGRSQIRAARLDVACFDTGRHEPASRYCAATVFFNDSPGSRRFLALMDHFMRPRLRFPININWMLDQAALYSVICQCRRAEPALSIGDLEALTGLTKDDVFVSLHPGALKNAMKWMRPPGI